MLRGQALLKDLKHVSGENSDTYSFQSGQIRRSSLNNGIRLYGMAIDKFLGNSLITRLMSSEFNSLDQLRDALRPRAEYGEGDWVDISGMLAPKAAVADLIESIECGNIVDVDMLGKLFHDIHDEYYEYEWKWAYGVIGSYYGISLSEASVEDLRSLVVRWKESVVALDRMIYEDARKEFSLSFMTSFGADGDQQEREQDFMNVRGSLFESDPFVRSVQDHIRVKSALGDEALQKLQQIC